MPSYSEKSEVTLLPKNSSMAENFSFNGLPIKARRFYNNIRSFDFTSTVTSLLGYGDVEDISWHPNGSLIMVALSNVSQAGGAQSTIKMYGRRGNGFLDQGFSQMYYYPGSWPANGNYDVADAFTVEWAPNGGYVAVGSNGAYKINVYKFDTGLFRLSNILQPTPPEYFSSTAKCTSISWSPDSNFIAASFDEDPYFYIIKVLDDGLELYCPLEENYSVSSKSCAWSPDGRYISVGYDRPPYLGIYEFDGKKLKKLPDPLALPSSYVNKVSWSPDGRYLACAHGRYPTITAYSFEKERLKRIPVNHDRVTTEFDEDACLDIKWSSDGMSLGAVFNIQPHVYFYSFDGSKIDQFQSSAQGDVNATVCSFSPDGEIFMLGTSYSSSGIGSYNPGFMLDIESPRNKPV